MSDGDVVYLCAEKNYAAGGMITCDIQQLVLESISPSAGLYVIPRIPLEIVSSIEMIAASYMIVHHDDDDPARHTALYKHTLHWHCMKHRPLLASVVTPKGTALVGLKRSTIRVAASQSKPGGCGVPHITRVRPDTLTGL